MSLDDIFTILYLLDVLAAKTLKGALVQEHL